MPYRTRLCLALAALGLATEAGAAACDYRPSKIAGRAGAAASESVEGGVAAAGDRLRSAGHYALAHPGTSFTLLSSGSAAASGILAGAGGVVGTLTAILTAPVTLVVGAVTFGGVAAYEGLCYFHVERVTDPDAVRAIVESIARNDETVSIRQIDERPALVLEIDGTERSYPLKRLYIEEGQLKHRDWGLNTDLGPVVFVGDAEEGD